MPDPGQYDVFLGFHSSQKARKLFFKKRRFGPTEILHDSSEATLTFNYAIHCSNASRLSIPHFRGKESGVHP